MADFDTRVGAYGVVIADDRILLVRWIDGGQRRWTLPGGGLEYGEGPEAAAVREVFEETGHQVALGRLLGFDTEPIPIDQRLHGATRPLHSLRILFEATIVGGALRAEADGTTDEARWFALDEIDGLHRVRLVDAALDLWRRPSPLGPDDTPQPMSSAEPTSRR